MTQTLLHIDPSVAGEKSVSRAASAKIVNDAHPDNVIRRDVSADPLPHIDGIWAQARLKSAEDLTAEDHDVLALSDTLIEELQAADTIVIGLPMYNFGVPASLKAWMDLVARPAVTFRYTEDGPEGLLKGKKAIVAMASGGVPLGAAMDFASPHIETFLKFIGITDVTLVNAQDIV